MSDRHSTRREHVPLDPPADALSLETMAAVDAFAATCVPGEMPPLSDWLRRYPEHAEALADFAAAFLSEPVRTVDQAGAERAHGGLSPGTRRALDQVFGGAFAGWPGHLASRVAESASGYDAGGILALARSHGLDLERLAQALDLSPQLLLWLDRTALGRERQPRPLVRRLADVLGVDRETVTRALAIAGDAASEGTLMPMGSLSGATSVEEAVRRATTLTAAQRERWLMLLGKGGAGAMDDAGGDDAGN